MADESLWWNVFFSADGITAVEDEFFEMFPQLGDSPIAQARVQATDCEQAIAIAAKQCGVEVTTID